VTIVGSPPSTRSWTLRRADTIWRYP
jgi:hypothetical protein